MGAYGIFLVAGLAVGAIYALSGVGIVVLYRSTGVLNLAYGAMGAMGAMGAWQLEQWSYPEAVGWAAAILIATVLSLAYGRLIAPRLAYREPVVKAVATLGYALIILGLATISGWRRRAGLRCSPTRWALQFWVFGLPARVRLP
jgi:branched-chain amino acid transport system permease protein